MARDKFITSEIIVLFTFSQDLLHAATDLHATFVMFDLAPLERILPKRPPTQAFIGYAGSAVTKADPVIEFTCCKALHMEQSSYQGTAALVLGARIHN